MMSNKEFIEKIKSGEAKVLTVEAAKLLKGKRIAWMYFGYMGQNSVREMTVGEIVTSLDYNETQPCDGFSSRAEYWRSYMTEKQLDEAKTTLLLLQADGVCPYINAHIKYNNFYDVSTFTCTDADREVYYVEI